MSAPDPPRGPVPPGSVRPPGLTRPVAVRPEHLYKAVGLLFLVAVLFHYLDPIVEVLLLAYAAAIAAVLFNAIVQKFPVGRKWVAAALGLAILGSLAALSWVGVPLLLRQARDVIARLPQLRAQLASLEGWIETNVGLDVSLVGPEAREALAGLVRGGGDAASFLSQAQGLLGAVLVPLLIIVGALYATAQPNAHLLSPLLRAVPRDHRLAFRRIFQLLGDRILGWGAGVLLAMLGVAVLSFALYSLIGVPNALLLAVIAGLTEAIPLVGPWVGGTVAVAVAFLDDPTKALYTALAAVVVQQVEANLITPFAMSRAAEIHPFVTLFALVLFGSLFGFLGVLLSIPLVLLIATVVEVLWIERAIDTDEDPIAPVVEE